MAALDGMDGTAGLAFIAASLSIWQQRIAIKL